MNAKFIALFTLLVAGCLGGSPGEPSEKTESMVSEQSGESSAYEAAMQALESGEFMEAWMRAEKCVQESQDADEILEKCLLILDISSQRMATTTTTSTTTTLEASSTTVTLKLIVRTPTTTPYTQGLESLFDKMKEREERFTTTTRSTTTTQYVTTSTFTVWTTPDYVNKYYIPNPGEGYNIDYPPGVDPSNVAEPTEE